LSAEPTQAEEDVERTRRQGSLAKTSETRGCAHARYQVSIEREQKVKRSDTRPLRRTRRQARRARRQGKRERSAARQAF